MLERGRSVYLIFCLLIVSKPVYQCEPKGKTQKRNSEDTHLFRLKFIPVIGGRNQSIRAISLCDSVNRYKNYQKVIPGYWYESLVFPGYWYESLIFPGYWYESLVFPGYWYESLVFPGYWYESLIFPGYWYESLVFPGY